jgi:hypothetical protein
MSVEQASIALKTIVANNIGTFHHPRLASLDTLFTFEVEILDNLIDAQCAISRLQMIQSLLHLKEAKDRLPRWLRASKETAIMTESTTTSTSWIRRLSK